MQQKLDSGSSDYYFKLQVPADRVEKLNDGSGRQVYVHQGSIDVAKYGGQAYKVRIPFSLFIIL